MHVQPPEQSDRHASGFSTRMSIAIALVLAAIVLIVGMNEEPYHIDELRQTRSYTMTVSEVIDRSFAQDQPPLDPVLNALAQRVIGQGDWQQRALSVFWALGGYACFVALAVRNRLARGLPVGLLAMALSPVLISVFAYARPYALPFFLMMVLLLATDLWLQTGRMLAGITLVSAALLLPLSRTIEPNIALGLFIVVILARKLRRHDDEDEGSPWLPLGAALVGISAIGFPVFLRLRSQLEAYTDQGLLPNKDQLLRLVTDVPEGLAAVVPLWPAALALIAVAVIAKPIRTRLISIWWFWVIALVPVLFTVLFVLTTDPGQPLYDRYFFTWIPPVALMLTVLVDEVTGSDAPASAALTAGVLVFASLFLVASGWRTALALSTVERGDWRALSESIEASTSSDTAVILESIVPFGDYRTPFAGKPRYLSSDRAAPHTPELIRNPSVIGDTSPIALAIIGPVAELDGWRRIAVDEYFSLYVADDLLLGPEDAARALEQFGRFYGPDRGATLLLAAASLRTIGQRPQEACELYGELTNIPSVGSEIRSYVDSGKAPMLAETC